MDTGQQQPAPNGDTDRDHQSDERDQNAEDVHDPMTTTEDDPKLTLIIRKFLFSRSSLATGSSFGGEPGAPRENKKIHDCWSNDGQIIIKDLSNKILLINSIKKLDDIVPVTEVV